MPIQPGRFHLTTMLPGFTTTSYYFPTCIAIQYFIEEIRTFIHNWLVKNDKIVLFVGPSSPKWHGLIHIFSVSFSAWGCTFGMHACTDHPTVMMSVLCRGVPQWRLWAPYGDPLQCSDVACASIEIQIIYNLF